MVAVCLAAASLNVSAEDAAKKPAPAAKAGGGAATPAAKPDAKPDANAPAKPAAAGTAAPGVAMPDADKLVLLVRATMLTLNDALQTGNYSVLRERGSPNFQNSATAQQLADAFAKLRALQLDLLGIAISVPQLVSAPSIDPQNRLRITGFFPGQGVQLNFDLQYEPVNGQWRLFALAVSPTVPQAAAQAAAAPPAEKPAEKPAPAAPAAAAKKK